MKKIFAVFLTLIVLASAFMLPASAFDDKTYYVDSINGSDENSGKSQTAAWKTLEKISSVEFSAGDRILLKSGQRFEGTFIAHGDGTEEEKITVSSYGEGNKPVICSEEVTLLAIFLNVSNWTLDNLEFTAPNGIGVYIFATDKKNSDNITIQNCVFHDISKDSTSTSFSAVAVNTDTSGAKVNGLHIVGTEFYNCCWAFHSNGVNAEKDKDIFENPEKDYSHGWVIENCYFHENQCAGIVLCSLRDSIVRNCKVENCATAQDSAYAPLWMRHSDNVTVEYCEISGSTNRQDGMAIDFDGWTVNSTYDHIYSHDNNRFIRNCVFDSKTKNNGNTVKNCISINDNKAINHSAFMLMSKYNLSLSVMTGFTFENNIIVNGSPFNWLFTPFANVSGNTFSASGFRMFLTKLFNIFSFSRDNEYVNSVENLDEKISEITERIQIY